MARPWSSRTIHTETWTICSPSSNQVAIDASDANQIRSCCPQGADADYRHHHSLRGIQPDIGHTGSSPGCDRPGCHGLSAVGSDRSPGWRRGTALAARAATPSPHVHSCNRHTRVCMCDGRLSPSTGLASSQRRPIACAICNSILISHSGCDPCHGSRTRCFAAHRSRFTCRSVTVSAHRQLIVHGAITATVMASAPIDRTFSRPGLS